MEIELKPCPTCGKLPKLRRVKHEYKYLCGLHCSCGDWKHSVTDAVTDWNRRSTGDGQPEYYKPANFEVITESPKKLAICLEHAIKAELDFCESREECQQGDIPEENCRKCLINWLNSPAKEESTSK